MFQKIFMASLLCFAPFTLVAAPQTITEIAAASPDFSILTRLLKVTGLDDALKSEGPFTVFAPTDVAFRKMDRAKFISLALDFNALAAALKYHVASGIIPSQLALNMGEINTLNGKTISFTNASSDIYLNDSAKIIQSDVQASNGLIHIIDEVLLP